MRVFTGGFLIAGSNNDVYAHIYIYTPFKHYVVKTKQIRTLQPWSEYSDVAKKVVKYPQHGEIRIMADIKVCFGFTV
jgi:hypothetical protein